MRETTGPGDMKTVLTTTNLAKKVTIAGKELVCREQATTTKGTGGDSTTTMLYSDKVPGGWVRNESNSTAGGMTTTSVTEVSSYEVK